MEHPYKNFENTKLWEIIESSINDLVSNQDIKITTNEVYIVGYLCKKLDENLVKSTNYKT